ncbi:MAG: diacylglycerol kinase [Candidatus Omnitrophica bacterium]|nr:diacylglycerol kinase [Candidatus Omnitrophota bacterium]
MGRQKLFESLNKSTEGFLYVLRTQRNMRLHFLMGTFVFILGIYLNLPRVELLLLFGVIILVLVVEMINTSIEKTIDLIKMQYHPLARIIKDVTAGAVLLTAINAVVVGYAIFLRRLTTSIEIGVNKIVHSPWHSTFIALIFVLFLVMAGKIFFHRGTPFRGGMPSGHAAFAFSMWTIIVFFTKNVIIIILSFVMAFMIARHRLKDRIHNATEVITGSVLGILATTLVFQLLLAK